MTPPKPLREWWIYEGPTRFKDKSGNKTLGLEAYDNQMRISECTEFHVIEYSAFESLRKELDMTQRTLDAIKAAPIWEVQRQLDEARAEVERLKTEQDNRCEELAEALGEVGIDVSCAYNFTDLVNRISSLVHEVELEKKDLLLTECAAALEKFARRPDLPKPNRDADWKNCVLWTQTEAKELLTKLKAGAACEKN